MQKYFLLAIVMWLFCSTNVFANGAAIKIVPGNQVIPIQQNDIRMTKEVVNIIWKEKILTTFTFENTTNKRIIIDMGFPFLEEDDPDGGLYWGSCKKPFTVRVNGKEIKALRHKISKKEKTRLDQTYDFMYKWKATFKSYEKMIVECEYCSFGKPIIEGEPDHIRYITKTGSLWKDTIGQADFYIDMGEHMPFFLEKKYVDLKISPPGYRIVNGRIIEWHFTNWEPKEDIYIEIKWQTKK